MEKQVILITGGAGGIGLSCAYGLKEYKIVITDYASEAVDKAVNQLTTDGIDAVGIACDITNQESISRLVEFTKAQGNLKAVVHSAGVSGSVNNPKIVFDVDLLATYNLIQAFKPLLNKGSAMILVSSMMGHIIPANEVYDAALRNPQQEDSFSVIEAFISNDANVMYNFAKRGVLLLTKDFAMELGNIG